MGKYDYMESLVEEADELEPVVVEEPVAEEPKPKKAPKPSHHVVDRRDTWGGLVAKYGSDIAAKNGKTFSDPLVAGARLEV